MKCAANFNQAQDVKRRFQPAIRWTLHRPVEKAIQREPVRPAAFGERRFDRTQRERSPPRSSMIPAASKVSVFGSRPQWDRNSRVRTDVCVRSKLPCDSPIGQIDSQEGFDPECEESERANEAS